MSEKKDNKYIRLIIIDIFVALILWALLIVLRGCGVIDLHWALTLSSLVFISWGLFALTALLVLAVYLIRRGLIKTIEQLWLRIVEKNRKENPELPRGKELEEAAWENFKIVRRIGETDEHLATRCIHAATIELLNDLEKEPEE